MAMQSAVKNPSGQYHGNIPPAPPLNLPSTSRGNIPPAPPLNLPSTSRGSIPRVPPLNMAPRSPDKPVTGLASYREPWSANLPDQTKFGIPLANSTMSEPSSPVCPRQNVTINTEYSAAGNLSYHSSDISDITGSTVLSDHTYERVDTTSLPSHSPPKPPTTRAPVRSVFSPPLLPARFPIVQRPEAFGYAEAGGETTSSEFTFSNNPFAKPGPCDPYVGSSLVVGLKKGTFKPFIKDVDAAFVLFYDPREENCLWAKKGIKTAALITNRPNHVYAAVDCTKECDLCRIHNVASFPTMKLYARGQSVNTFNEDTFINANEMKRFVEQTPCVGRRLPGKDQCKIS